MSKANDVEDLLGEAPAKKTTKTKAAPAKEAAPATKGKTKAPAAEAPAKKATKKSTVDVLAEETVAKKGKAKAAPAEAKEPKERVAKEPVTFAEGERDEIIKRIKANAKKPINSRDLAAKLGIETRKLRPCLYTAQKRGIVTLEAGASPVAGMTVSLAAA